GRLAGDEVDHLLDAARGGVADLWPLAWYLRAERGSCAASLNPFDVRLREIGPHHGLERLWRRRGGGDALHHCHAFTAGAVGSLGEHRLARREVGIEAAVCQAGVLHDVGDARAVVAAAPDGTRGGLDDAVMRRFLGPGGGSLHMTCIILHSGAQRKGAFVPLGCSPDSSFCANANVRVWWPVIMRAGLIYAILTQR